jgi:hypothetical protein
MKAKRSDLIALIRDLRRAVVIEASGGEGEKSCGEVVAILNRADRVLKQECNEA